MHDYDNQCMSGNNEWAEESPTESINERRTKDLKDIGAPNDRRVP